MEIRKDYFLDRWVIISEARANRPHKFAAQKEDKSASCDFCPGFENMTPPEIYRLGNDKWKVRVIPNKYSFVEPCGNPDLRTDNTFYTFANAYGNHELIIETPDHGKLFGDISEKDLVEVFKVYSLRISENQKKEKIKYVSLFKNQGKEAGASLPHIHSQLVSLSNIPPSISEKVQAVRRFNKCPYCEIMNDEKDSYRRCFENDSFISFTPYASRFNYEIWILPKKHILSFDDFSEKNYNDLASMMSTICKRLEQQGFPYNLSWNYSPEGENLHFHIEIMPRISTWAGFELGSNIIVNKITPENAAKFYRGE